MGPPHGELTEPKTLGPCHARMVPQVQEEAVLKHIQILHNLIDRLGWQRHR